MADFTVMYINLQIRILMDLALQKLRTVCNISIVLVLTVNYAFLAVKYYE